MIAGPRHNGSEMVANDAHDSTDNTVLIYNNDGNDTLVNDASVNNFNAPITMKMEEAYCNHNAHDERSTTLHEGRAEQGRAGQGKAAGHTRDIH